MLLDAMNEKIVRVQLVRHDQIVVACHGGNYPAGRRRLSTAPEGTRHPNPGLHR
jgi:hypothetical protein